MVPRPPLLILLTLLLALAGCTPQGAASSCVGCHPPHYADRGSCTGCHRGDDRSVRPAVAHRDLVRGRYAAFTLGETVPVQQGRKLLDRCACRRCHLSGGTGTRLAPSLDSQWRSTPEQINAAIREPALFMPDFHCTDEQLVELVNAILFWGQREGKGQREQPVVVHFAPEGEGENIFAQRCGPCHRALTERFGGLGRGAIGPNLAGLFTPFYPANFGAAGKRWTSERLRHWLKNPRQLRPVTTMPPQRLTGVEFDRLMETLNLSPGKMVRESAAGQVELPQLQEQEHTSPRALPNASRPSRSENQAITRVPMESR